MDSEDDSGSDHLSKVFSYEGSGIDSAMDSDSDLMMMDSAVDSVDGLLEPFSFPHKIGTLLGNKKPITPANNPNSEGNQISGDSLTFCLFFESNGSSFSSV